jgi:hypothetical protein
VRALVLRGPGIEPSADAMADLSGS